MQSFIELALTVPEIIRGVPKDLLGPLNGKKTWPEIYISICISIYLYIYISIYIYINIYIYIYRSLRGHLGCYFEHILVTYGAISLKALQNGGALNTS